MLDDVASEAGDDGVAAEPDKGIGCVSVFVASGAGASVAGCATAGFEAGAAGESPERVAESEAAAPLAAEPAREGVLPEGGGSVWRSRPISAASLSTIADDDATTLCSAARAHAPA